MIETPREKIDAYLNGSPFAVVGASTDREKYGNKVLRVYQQKQMVAYPINPKAGEIEGLQAYRSLAELPERVHGISITTPPAVTEKIVDEAIEQCIWHIWMQPGAESDAAVEKAEAAGINVIANGACILVILGYRER